MRKPSIILFVLRLFFYLSVAALVLLHPGITISYDRIGLIQWFVIIPFQMLIAFLPAPGKKMQNKLLIALTFLCGLSVWAGGLSPAALPIVCAGAISFVLTFLLFHYPKWGKLSALEPFFLAWVCFRLLVFSRSGEDAAAESSGLTQFILVWTAVVFLFHSAVVYFSLYPHSSGGAKTEGAVFALAAAAALVAVVFILPADFVRNTVIANLLSDRIERMTKPSDNEWGIPDTGGGRRRGRDTVPGNEDGQSPGLRGLSENEWPSEGRRGRGNNGGQSQQYTVMVVASKQEPVYMGNAVRGNLDPVDGFLIGPEETLNRLPSQRLFVTWFDNEPVFDRGRQRFEVFSLSILPQKYLPYRPYAVEPTVQSENTGPFRYIHRLTSNIHRGDPLELVRQTIRELSPLEKTNLAPYLELPLKAADRAVFEEQLSRFDETWEITRGKYIGDIRNEYMEKIFAILTGFSEYQYNANDGNDAPISHLIEFLLNTKDGDCVEFSNTAALLGRLAGIPSRVVTGYLAAEGLQTPAHLRGLAVLRSRLPVLQDFPFEDLFLVTDAHGHSWPQFYVPDYGWLDFEATQFAIPPIGFGDGNLRDVVIPLFNENQVFSQVRAFPWRAVLRSLAYFAVSALIGAYLLRYGREAVLALGVRQGGRKGARSLYLLLLSRLAADGKPIKPVSKTAPEYARLFPEEGPFNGFAAVYTEIRWRSFSDKTEEDARLQALKAEYRKILAATRRRGPVFFFVRIFSLRPLAYL